MNLANKSPSAAFRKEKKKGGKQYSSLYICFIIHPLLSHFKILNSQTYTASGAAGLEQTQEMKNLIDDLIHCCPPQAFHLVLSLLCTGSFKPL